MHMPVARFVDLRSVDCILLFLNF